MVIRTFGRTVFSWQRRQQRARVRQRAHRQRALSYENRSDVPMRFLCMVPVVDTYQPEWLNDAD
jgi:hypothetical protein